MLLQSDIISCIQGCKYISLMNDAVFFHQGGIQRKNRHKMTMITHRDAEQGNVDVMKFKNFSAYVQRQMNNHLRQYREFVRFYIDDIVIFNKILKKHIEHLCKVFELFGKINIILKFTKIFLIYFTIELLNQKVDSFELITAKKKLKIITTLSFLKTLKKFENYLKFIEYLKNYISYYAQKTESLQKRKTMLFKNNSIQNLKKKTFFKKKYLKISTHEKQNAFEQLQKDFNKSNGLTHYDKTRILFVDVNASKNDFDVIIYHFKKKINSNKLKILSKRDVDFILFLNKIFTSTESRYGSTELKITDLVGTIRKIVHLIKTSNHSTVIYTNHDAISRIANQTKLNSINIDKQNLKLIRASMYLFQFKLKIRHKFEKFNVIPDALNKLSNRKHFSSKIINLKNFDESLKNSKNDQIYAYANIFIEMSKDFRAKIIKEYIKKKYDQK